MMINESVFKQKTIISKKSVQQISEIVYISKRYFIVLISFNFVGEISV